MRFLVVPILLHALAAAAPQTAQAQGHPRPPDPRPISLRLDLADVVTVVRIDSLEPGRLNVTVEHPLKGETPDRFQVKRAASRPNLLAAGDRAVMFLVGARPPYVSIDKLFETIRLVDDESARRWIDAVEAVMRQGDDPELQLELYLGWVDTGPETLRGLAMLALSDRQAPFYPIPEPVLLARADAALDPTRSLEARRASARIAVRSPGGAGRLLEAIPTTSSEADVAAAMVALQGGALHQVPEFVPALLRSLRHESPGLRMVAIRLSTSLREDPPEAVVERLFEIARTTASDETENGEARRVLGVLGALGK